MPHHEQASCPSDLSALKEGDFVDMAREVLRTCFAQNPGYVFGAANYLSMLISAGRMDEAKAMIENYRLPQRIHPEAYLSWCRVELTYYDRVGDEERFRNVQNAMKSLLKQLGRKG